MDLNPLDALVLAFLLALLVALVVQAQALGNLRTRVARLERAAKPTPPPGSTGLPPHVEGEVLRLVTAGKKINAIKLVRDQTGMGLKEAKDLVDRM